VDKIKLSNIVLKMWEKTMMPESVLQDGKYVKTGKKLEQTTYTFVDEWGNKLVFLSDNQGLRKSEGKLGVLEVALTHDNFNKINKMKFVDFLSSE